MGDRESVYSALFFDPQMARRLAEQIRLRSMPEAREVPRMGNELVGPPLSLREQSALLWRLIRGKGRFADKCTIQENLLNETIVLCLGSQREAQSAATYELARSSGLGLAARFERAASVAEGLPPGSRVRNVA